MRAPVLRSIRFITLSVAALSIGCAPGGGGACDPPCAAGSHCEASVCVPDVVAMPDLAAAAPDLMSACTCVSPTPHCDGSQRCQVCVEDKHCPSGQICRQSPLGNSCVPGCTDDSRCNGGLKCCAGACVDLTKDARNCGACGTICMSVNGRAVCAGGVCMAGTCNTGWGDCNMDGRDGCEANLNADAKNCMACGAACAFANAIPGCAHGCFIKACSFGYDNCNNMDKDGCETAVGSDIKNCGACGKACAQPARTKVVCNVGQCQVTGCDPGYSDCDKSAANGCEVATGTDVNNCGTCGNVCPQNTACVNGACTCKPCSIANATPACINYQCVIDTCNAGFGDCDKNPANGCERPLSADVNNCGACGKVCPQGLVCSQGSCTCAQCNIPNAKSVCVNNQCILDSCLPGFDNCDGNGANGCEKDVRSDAKNCGACGLACPMNAPFCTGGKCNNILASCKEYAKGGGQPSGVYTVDPDGAGPIQPYDTFCDMSTDGGGWTLVVNRLTMSDNTGQPDINTSVGVFDKNRATNFTLNIAPYYATAAEVAFAVKHNTNCAGCNINQYDSAIKVPRSANNTYATTCPSIESVTATKLIGPSAGQQLTAYRCLGSLGWGSCGGSVCHYGTHGMNTLSDGSWSQNTASEMHFPSAYSSYRTYTNAGGYCRSCGGAITPGMFNPLSSTCCNQPNSPDNSTWTIWVR